MKNRPYLLSSILLAFFFGIILPKTSFAQCPPGQVEVTIDVTTDNWGYECYWELGATGFTCGSGFFMGGNSAQVGCSGGGAQTATSGGYGNNVTVTEGPWCLPIGFQFDIIYVDDWGDGGATFTVYADGVPIGVFSGSGTGGTFTFTAAAPPAYDAAVISTRASEYGQIPLSQVTPVNFDAEVQNLGINTMTNVEVKVNVYPEHMMFALDFTDSITVPSVLSGATANFNTFGSYTPADTGVYLAEFVVDITEADGNATNDTLYSFWLVTDSTLGRDLAIFGETITGLGFGPTATTMNFIGTPLGISNATNLTSVTFFLAPLAAADVGRTVSVQLFNYGMAGPTGTVIATSNSTTIISDTISLYTVGFPSPVALSPGTYFYAVRNVAYVGQTDNINNPGNVWGSSNAAVTWTDFTPTFPGALMIWANFGTSCFAFNATSSITNESCNGGTGAIDLSVPGGTPPFTYSWSNGDTSQDLSGLSSGSYSVLITDASGCDETLTFTVTNVGSAPALTTASTDAACGLSDGTATVTVTSGNPTPYTYSWSNGQTTQTATGLAAGSYTVLVMDNDGCDNTTTVLINNAGAPSIGTPATTDVSCNGGTNGTASISASGGTMPYTYLWSTGSSTNSVSGLSAGTYSVTVTDSNNCSVSTTVTISQPTAITGSVSGNDISCNGANDGSAISSAAGGTGTLSYAWSPSGGNMATATGLAPGSYSVTVTDANNCTWTSGQVTINEPPVLSGSATSTDISCNGANDGSAAVTAAGGTAPYTYAWSPSGGSMATAAGLGTGTYTVTVTDANGCTTSEMVSVTEPAALAANTSSTDETVAGANDGTATAAPTGGTPPYTYSWSSGQTTAMISGLMPGNYTVNITDANGCTTAGTIFIMGGATGIDDMLQAGIQELVTFPNPSSGIFTLRVGLNQSDELSVEIYDIRGKRVYKNIRNQVREFNETIDLSSVSAGVYMLRVRTSMGMTHQRIVIE